MFIYWDMVYTDVAPHAGPRVLLSTPHLVGGGAEWTPMEIFELH